MHRLESGTVEAERKIILDKPKAAGYNLRGMSVVEDLKIIGRKLNGTYS